MSAKRSKVAPGIWKRRTANGMDRRVDNLRSEIKKIAQASSLCAQIGTCATCDEMSDRTRMRVWGWS
jgi:hypothetical protein